jgi:DNA-binding XRE family transcriptional regulator
MSPKDQIDPKSSPGDDYETHMAAVRAAWSPEIQAFAHELGEQIDFRVELRSTREKHDLTLTEVGRATGVAPNDVSLMERGRLKPAAEERQQILLKLRLYVLRLTQP